MPNDPVIELLAHATEALEAEFCSLPDYAAEPGAGAEAMGQVLAETAHRLGDNYPYFHPLYAGQMLKPPHPVARAAYALAMKINYRPIRACSRRNASTAISRRPIQSAPASRSPIHPGCSG